MSDSARELVLASSNRGKLREIAAILAEASGARLRLRPLSDFPDVRLPPEGDDYAANARAKARTVAAATGLPALADDSGLEVEALDGAPGPRSARYGGPRLDDAGRCAHLLAALEGLPAPRRAARFVCVAVLAWPDGSATVARGECPGHILEAPRGRGGFGYDPVFAVAGRDISMAELPAVEKDALSHRGRAFRALLPALERA